MTAKTPSSLVMLAVFTVAGASAWGQYYVQQGNVLDANNRVGSGGLNYGARSYAVNSANRLVTGNVTGGRYFQGFSPVRDSSSLFLSGVSGVIDRDNLGIVSGRATLPSDRLSSFRRDSYSVGDPVRNINTPAPYYPLSSTVADTGAIARGLNRPGSSQLRSSYMLPQPDLRATPSDPLDTARSSLVGRPLSVQPQLVRIDTGQAVTGRVNPQLLASPLFGAFRQVPVGDLAAKAEQNPLQPTSPTSPLDLRVGSRTPVDLRVDRLVDRRAVDLRSDADRLAGLPPGTSLTGEGEPGIATGLSGMTTASLFDRMQAAAGGALARPLARPGETAEEAQPRGTLLQPTAASVQQAETVAQAQPVLPEAVRGGFDAPLRSFVGTEESAVNRYLKQAEDELHAGNYYKAADAYSLAHMVDARNPLPLLGRSMALLAAGDYLSSANDLFQAIQLFESLARFDVDLKQFIPDLRALDRRRAYLEQRLQTFDDFRLRFLLGYAEYSSGLTDIGLANMRKAAESAPPRLDSIRRFVEMLEVRHGEGGPIQVPGGR